MQILLTGSEGFVGKTLRPMLREHDVTCFDFFDLSQSTETVYREKLTETTFGKRFDVVIHLGSMVQTQTSDLRIFHWNTVCSRILFAKYYDSKVIFISSNMAVNPVNLYGWSKRLAEDAVRMTCHDYCILRPSAIFGEPFDRSSPLPVVDLIITGRISKLYDKYLRDYIHVRDVAKGIVRTVEKPLNGTFNLGTAIGYSAVELAEAYGATDIPVVDRPDDVAGTLLAPQPLFPFEWEPLDPVDYLKETRESARQIWRGEK